MFDLTLSFDNGPDPEVTPRVLDILRARSLRSTFFVLGKKLADPTGRKLALKIRADGHRIANHTFTHSIPLGQNPALDVVQTEIVATDRLLEEIGTPTRLFRPFGGGGNLDHRLLKQSVVDHLVAERYSCVLWNSIPRDWADPEGWVDTALDQCQSQPWSLMVLHDLPTGAMDHLELFLDKAEALGARFREDFPPDCVPIVDGDIVRPLAGYTSDLA
jgi:peptidoglycan-N-acetylglucosamine deacetylase